MWFTQSPQILDLFLRKKSGRSRRDVAHRRQYVFGNNFFCFPNQPDRSQSRLQNARRSKVMRHRALGITFALAAASAATVLPLRSQAQPQKPHIEVASIKPNDAGPRGSNSTNTEHGTLTATNVTLRSLILLAYNLSDYELIGGPEWVGTATFDIQAKSDADPNAKPNPRGLIQALVEDRFQLRTHRETRELPVFLLTVTKGGPKIQRAEGQPDPSNPSRGAGSVSRTPVSTEIKGTAVTIPQLIRLLSPHVERTIIDKTNLTGDFDFSLKFARPMISALPTASDAGNSGLPDFFTAIQEQLGLKLESGKGPVEVLMIDSVDKPKPN